MFKEINTDELCFNPFTMLGSEWALLTSGDDTSFNMMTVSWGGFGVLWGKNAVTVYVRDSRYTRKFTDKNELFTLSFYGKAYRRALNICGSLHGNECDKAKESGLTPFFTDGTAAFEEASLIFVCRKMFHADIERDAADAKALFDNIYPEPDYHRIYIGEVLKVLKK